MVKFYLGGMDIGKGYRCVVEDALVRTFVWEVASCLYDYGFITLTFTELGTIASATELRVTIDNAQFPDSDISTFRFGGQILSHGVLSDQIAEADKINFPKLHTAKTMKMTSEASFNSVGADGELVLDITLEGQAVFTSK